jgi:hypothetical protein
MILPKTLLKLVDVGVLDPQNKSIRNVSEEAVRTYIQTLFLRVCNSEPS